MSPRVYIDFCVTLACMTPNKKPTQNLKTQTDIDLARVESEALLQRAMDDPAVFVESFVSIDSPEKGGWIPFELWESQRDALAQMHAAQKVVILKARQLGLTWLSLSYALWLMTLHAPATVLLFSLREKESIELLRRLRLMHEHLPAAISPASTTQKSADRWELSNGSRAIAFSTRSGRSYTGNLAIVDEADFVPNLADFLNAVKPTIDAGGRLQMISTVDKAEPQSAFKRIFRAAQRGESDYRAIFLPWYARTDRTPEWYVRISADMRAQRGSDDDLHQEYPSTAEEALRVRSLAARMPIEWIEAITQPLSPLPSEIVRDDKLDTLIASKLCRIFVLPNAGSTYAIGADPAEGNPRSDESAAVVLNTTTGEQMALLAGTLEPELFARACATLSDYYNGAPILVERNNHGHTVLAHLREFGTHTLSGSDGKRGWLTTSTSKTILYNALASAVREGALCIHDAESATQLASIDAVTLRAPTGLHDDRAMALALAQQAMQQATYVSFAPIPPAAYLS